MTEPTFFRIFFIKIELNLEQSNFEVNYITKNRISFLIWTNKKLKLKELKDLKLFTNR